MNGKDILIVEDETIVALDMKMRLESLGYTVVEVVDTGALALEFLAKAKPDLVLMDIKLKGALDGIETARKARERVEVPIIFVTAFTDETTLERAKHASPYGYIVKPFHERELRIAIELALYKFQYELSMRRQVDLAEEANRLKSEFLANVSHELKTPLNSVIGFTELSLDRAADEEQREYLSTVLRSARSLVTLIDSILDFARLEKDRLAPVYASFPLDELLGECADFMAVGARSKGLEVGFRLDRALPPSIVSDRGRLRQVLMNLLDNAVKFTEKGRIRLEASWAPREAAPPVVAEVALIPTLEPGSQPFVLRLVVEDSGIGMPPEKIAKAFERFTQLDGSSTRQAGGTGLGLAIVSKSVDLLGGTLQVRSSPGEGSRFEILVPVWSDARVPRSPGLPGLSFALVGFGTEARTDIDEALASLGATGNLVASFEEAAQTGGYVLADEKMASVSHSRLSSFAGRLIVACRPGFIGRTDLAAAGCAIIPYPVRASSLPDAVAALLGQGGGRATASPSPGTAIAGGQRDAQAAGAESLPREAPPRDAESAELESFIAALEAALDSGDLASAEREAKEYRDRFLESGADRGERLAFTALLLARKGDREGMANVIKRARLALGSGLVHKG